MGSDNEENGWKRHAKKVYGAVITTVVFITMLSLVSMNSLVDRAPAPYRQRSLLQFDNSTTIDVASAATVADIVAEETTVGGGKEQIGDDDILRTSPTKSVTFVSEETTAVVKAMAERQANLYEKNLFTDPDGTSYYLPPGCHDKAGAVCTAENRIFFLTAILVALTLSFCGCDRCLLGYGCCCCFWKPLTLGGLFIWFFYDLATMYGVFGAWTDASGCCPIYGGFGFPNRGV